MEPGDGEWKDKVEGDRGVERKERLIVGSSCNSVKSMSAVIGW